MTKIKATEFCRTETFSAEAAVLATGETGSPRLPENLYVADAALLPQGDGQSADPAIMALAKRIALVIHA